ncbi:single-stranded-DNA-specific exonuclease RecJ [Candidatus Gracilibacteria bacterium]|nr:single-stranded-DNA-specific exonuclease RecJ [Candidatus Gracilibacteria bacterium]
MKVNKKYTTRDGKIITLKNTEILDNISDFLHANCNIKNDKKFFKPTLADLVSPLLLPDIFPCTERILEAKKKNERVVIFGDYDVDGVSSTALLVRFLTKELRLQVSYRLPHREHDGYGLKSYFFDDLKEKNVALVITVDCGTKDIEPIKYAKSLGIDVIVTDHHAVPEIIPKEVIGIVNPKRTDIENPYPFPLLAGAGVAFKFAHAILLRMYAKNIKNPSTEEAKKIEKILIKYVDFASLGTVADCMPLTEENRIITKLGLTQMQKSQSAGLKKFLENHDDIDGNADIIGFQIGPRINASGRMDTPLTALRWLLASEKTCDSFFEEIENLNTLRKETVKSYSENALEKANPNDGILFFVDDNIGHGLIGLVAGRLTETYNRPSIVLASQIEENEKGEKQKILVASCRSPEWCSMIDLLDESSDFLLRYGGHKQAAGFSISAENFEKFKTHIQEKFAEKHDIKNLPKPEILISGVLSPESLTLENYYAIQKFRPFGIGNPAPIWFLPSVTIRDHKWLGQDKNHLTFSIQENPRIKFLMWNAEKYKDLIKNEHQFHLVITLDKNVWNGNESVQVMVQEIVEV